MYSYMHYYVISVIHELCVFIHVSLCLQEAVHGPDQHREPGRAELHRSEHG